MAFQQDYLLRMIRDVGALLTRVVRMRRQGETEQALSLLVDESTRLSGIPESLVYALSDEDLINTLQARGVLETERCYALAEIFREEGEIFLDRDDQTEALLRLSKAIRLYTVALRYSDPDSELIQIAGLRDALSHVPATALSASSLDALTGELMNRHAYDLVDNLLYELLESPDHHQTAVERADELYRRMLQQSDFLLSKSNLERSEIEEALANLHDEFEWT